MIKCENNSNYNIRTTDATATSSINTTNDDNDFDQNKKYYGNGIATAAADE